MKKSFFLIIGVLCVIGIAYYFFYNPCNHIFSISPKLRYIASGAIKLDEIEEKQCGKVIRLKNPIGSDNQTNFIILLKKGKVYEDGIILTKDDEIVEDVTIIAYGKKIKDHRLLRVKKTRSSPKVVYFPGKLAVIDQPGSGNYYHWLFQVVPKIKLLQLSPVKWDKIYIPKANTKFQKDTLKLLNLREDQIFLGKEDTITVADTLIVPSIPVWLMKGKYYSLWVIKFLNDTFLKKSDIKPNNNLKRIYISRAKRPSRRVSNEKQLMAFLSKKGFEKIYLEDLSILDQSRLFNQVEVIIGTHGAGLSNIVFANSGATLIEITEKSETHPNRAYEKLAETKEINYYRFQASEQLVKDLDELHAYNVYIDIPRFKDFLSERCSIK